RRPRAAVIDVCAAGGIPCSGLVSADDEGSVGRPGGRVRHSVDGLAVLQIEEAGGLVVVDQDEARLAVPAAHGVAGRRIFALAALEGLPASVVEPDAEIDPFLLEPLALTKEAGGARPGGARAALAASRGLRASLAVPGFARLLGGGGA